jgi:hypothetical protein
MKLRVVLALNLLLVFVPVFGFAAVVNPVRIDFSYAGYQAGGQTLPTVPAVISVRPSGKDDTDLLQSAIDHVAALPLDAHGFRGAVLLRPGRFHPVLGEAVGVTDETVAAGSRLLTVASTSGLSVGDHVVIRRPSTREWISAIGMSGLPGTFANQRLDWQPGSHDLVWDRVITSVNVASSQIELDAPITTALEKKYGAGTVAKVQSSPALQHIGIEDLVLDSAYDATRPKDEDHAWIAIALNHVEDGWIGRVTARHFVSSAVRTDQRARRITVEDCRSEPPVAEAGGYRRQGFIVYGQQVLFHRCHSEAGMNDFATGLLSAGPNVFLDCEATGSLGASGAFEGWSSGVLYERVHVPDSHIELLEDQNRAQAAGWTAANSLIWNSAAKASMCLAPRARKTTRLNRRNRCTRVNLPTASCISLCRQPVRSLLP